MLLCVRAEEQRVGQGIASPPAQNFICWRIATLDPQSSALLYIYSS